MDNTQGQVNILWTGGYDSSFRMVQLSKKNVVIQPYYLSDNRIGEKNELNAIAEITADIRAHPETKSTILPLIVHKVADLKADEEITQSFKKLRQIMPIGPQYEWLARFAKENNLHDLELGIEKSNTCKLRLIFAHCGETQLEDNGLTAYYTLNKEGSDPDLYRIFGRFHYPSPLFDMTKIDMLAEYENLGFEDSMKKTWFCHNPVNNEPCGFCSPCKSAYAEGMGFRFPKSSLTRYKYRKAYRVKNFITRKLKKI